MPLIKWRESYSVGVSVFDEQHKKLVTLINEMFQLVRDKDDTEKILQYLDELIDYTKEHFGDEEAAMEQSGYPLIEEHKAIHADLLKQVLDFQKRVQEKSDEVSVDLYQFLREWLLTHILEEDKKYAEKLAA